MSRILIVAYSFTGTSQRLARLLASLQHWPLAEVRELRPRMGAQGNWRCLLDSLFRCRPPIRFDGPDPAQFDAVVLISPIWAFHLAGPMRSFIAEYRHVLRDVGVISVMGDKGAPNAVAEVTQMLGKTPLLSTAFKAREIESGSSLMRLQAFADALESAKDSLPNAPVDWSPLQEIAS